MTDERTNLPIFDVWDVWKQYEKIAMHFNDLLMKIRIQALGVVATLSTLISIMSGTGEGGTNWDLLMISFVALSMIWLAIWVLDFSYYNRLLIGAVFGLLELEEHSKTGATVDEIQLSTRIEQAVAKKLPETGGPRVGKGRWIFYILVMAVLLAISTYSFAKIRLDETEAKPAPALLDTPRLGDMENDPST